jgi:hypothetical protein
MGRYDTGSIEARRAQARRARGEILTLEDEKAEKLGRAIGRLLPIAIVVGFMAFVVAVVNSNKRFFFEEANVEKSKNVPQTTSLPSP